MKTWEKIKADYQDNEYASEWYITQRRLKSICKEIDKMISTIENGIELRDTISKHCTINKKKILRHSEQISELKRELGILSTAEGLRRVTKVIRETGISVKELEQAHCKHIYGIDSGYSDPSDQEYEPMTLISICDYDFTIGDTKFKYCPKCGKELT